MERSNIKNLVKGIRNKEGYQIKIGHSTPLISNLEMEKLFKDKNKKKRAGITDLISKIVQVLRGDLYWVKINIQKVGLMEPVKP